MKTYRGATVSLSIGGVKFESLSSLTYKENPDYLRRQGWIRNSPCPRAAAIRAGAPARGHRRAARYEFTATEGEK